MPSYAVPPVAEGSEHASLWMGERDLVESLKIGLKLVQSFLRDAGGKQIKDERDRHFLKELREIAYDAEDVIEKCMIERGISRRKSPGVSALVACFMILPRKLRYSFKVKMNIEAIRAKLDDISNARKKYDITKLGEGNSVSSSSTEGETRRSTTSPLIEENSIISTEDEEMKIPLNELIEGDDRRRVISIVGMGGIGKTTLARGLFNHSAVRRHFDCFAWVCVTHEFRTRDLLQEILEQVNAPGTEERTMMRRMYAEKQMEMLYRFFEDKRYLVVLDDVWSFNAWENLSPAFPNGRTGSRILLTSRNMEIAIQADPYSRPHQVGLLTAQKSWELFFRTVFDPDQMKSRDRRLEMLGRKIVAKCAGVPLVIRVLGGLLRNKRSLKEWENVIQFTFDFSPGTSRTLEILSLCYDDLPYHLKPFFLYLGMFPSEIEISTKRLIRLWIAEGLIIAEDNKISLEDVGEGYLNELIARSMVLVGKLSSTGRVTTFRLHDIMLNLCVAKATEEGFFHNVNEASSSFSDVLPDAARRCAVHGHNDSRLKQSTGKLRTLLLFNVEDNRRRLDHVIEDFKLLRILDLEGVNGVEILPAMIASLVHLRYLGLKHSYIQELPCSIGDLWSLQTLDLRYCAWDIEMPDVIWKMEQLRHLNIGAHFHSGHLRMDPLKNLSTLKHMRAGIWINHLANLTNLRELGIRDLSVSQLKVAIDVVAVSLESLRSLWLSMDGAVLADEFADLEPLSKCNSLLKLHFEGPVTEEKPMVWPPNLVKLTLIDSKLKEKNLMETLGNLQRLVVLRLLGGSFKGNKLVCTARGFIRLQVLCLSGLENLEKWEIERGAMPCLTQLDIRRCPIFRFTVEELKLIPKLQELKIKDMPREFEDKIRGEGKNSHGSPLLPSIVVS